MNGHGQFTGRLHRASSSKSFPTRREIFLLSVLLGLLVLWSKLRGGDKEVGTVVYGDNVDVAWEGVDGELEDVMVRMGSQDATFEWKSEVPETKIVAHQPGKRVLPLPLNAQCLSFDSIDRMVHL